jgi:hypothetical protein
MSGDDLFPAVQEPQQAGKTGRLAYFLESAAIILLAALAAYAAS